MEVGEDQLSFAHQLVFRLDGFLHLDNHVALAINVLDGRQDAGTSLHILIVSESATLASRMLYTNLMTTSCQFSHTRRRHTHAILIVLNLFGNSYFHNALFLDYNFRFLAIDVANIQHFFDMQAKSPFFFTV